MKKETESSPSKTLEAHFRSLPMFHTLGLWNKFAFVPLSLHPKTSQEDKVYESSGPKWPEQRAASAPLG